MVDLLTQPFLKAITGKELPEEAWRIVLGRQQEAGDLATLHREVPWLFRAVDLRSQAVAGMPFAILRGDTEVDSSANYKNAVGLLPNPGALFGLVEAALCVWGYAYLEKVRNIVATKGLYYLLPTTIKPKFDPEAGLVGFERTLGNGRTVQLRPEDLCYFWKLDPFVEIGPPRSSPALAAAAAAGVTLNVNKFASAFFARGAVKTTLLTVSGNVLAVEKERLESWWRRVATGIKDAFASKVINADRVTPVVVGEGLSELTNKELSTDTREQIATALGIPHSVLFSGAANFSVSQQDDLHFYSKTIVPECQFIQGVLNEQVLEPMGLRLEFRPESLDIFQEDEKERSASLSSLVSAGVPLALAMEILGFDLTEEQWDELRAEMEERKERAATISQRMSEPRGEDEDQDGQAAVRAELRRWARKTAKRRRPTDWQPQVLSPGLVAAIRAAQELLPDPVSAFDFALRSVDDWRAEAEKVLQGELLELFERWLERYSGAIAEGAPLPWDEFIASLDGALYPRITAIMVQEALRDMSAVGIGFDPAAINTRALEWARTYTYDLIRGLTETTRGTVAEAMTRWQSTPGMTREELEALLRPAFGEARAETIAVTEVTRASTQATNQQQAFLAESGLQFERKWLTNRDELVCPLCGPLHGKLEDEPVPGHPDPEIAEKGWGAGSRSQAGPPYHPRCRCDEALVYVGGE